eukprot:6481431-Amphidinium_carterae.1
MPVLPFAQPIQSKSQSDVAKAVADMASTVEAIRIPQILPGQRIRRIQSDRGTEWFGGEASDLCQQRGWLWTYTTGYNPQANGTAESGVRLIKDLARRALVESGLPECFWTFAVTFVAEGVCFRKLQGKGFPAFGARVVVKRLEPEGEKSTWKPRGSEGLAPTSVTDDSFVSSSAVNQ